MWLLWDGAIGYVSSVDGFEDGGGKDEEDGKEFDGEFEEL